MLPPLTETELAELVPFLEYCAERGIETGWEYIGEAREPYWIHIPSKFFSYPHTATREQYNSLCWIGTKWLRDMHDRFIDENIDGEWEAVHTNWYDDSGNYDPFKTGIPATEPELAAITAAMREVE